MIPKKYIKPVSTLLQIPMDNLLLGREVSDHYTFNFELLDVEVSMGSGLTASDENVVQSLSVNVEKFQEVYRKQATDTMKLVSARGDSMSPKFNDQDILLVDTSLVDNVSDGVYVFRSNDELFCKRLQKLPNKIVCISDNPNYQTFDLPNDAKLIAKVVDVWCHHFA